MSIQDAYLKGLVVEILDSGKLGYREDAQVMRIWHKGHLLREEIDRGEPEDNSYSRDWSWVNDAILDAYKRGLEDGRITESKQHHDIQERATKNNRHLQSNMSKYRRQRNELRRFYTHVKQNHVSIEPIACCPEVEEWT